MERDMTQIINVNGLEVKLFQNYDEQWIIRIGINSYGPYNSFREAQEAIHNFI
jgi:hypothetical protein